MSTPVFRPPPSVLSTPAAQALHSYYTLWGGLPAEGEGSVIDWEKRFLFYPKIFASDVVFTLPFACALVSPSMPVSPLPSMFNGLDEVVQFYSKSLMGCTVLRSYDVSVQPFPESIDYAWGQCKKDFQLTLPNGKKYVYEQQFTSQCRVNEQGLIVEYEEKWNPGQVLKIFAASAEAAAVIQAAALTQTE